MTDSTDNTLFSSSIAQLNYGDPSRGEPKFWQLLTEHAVNDGVFPFRKLHHISPGQTNPLELGRDNLRSSVHFEMPAYLMQPYVIKQAAPWQEHELVEKLKYAHQPIVAVSITNDASSQLRIIDGNHRVLYWGSFYPKEIQIIKVELHLITLSYEQYEKLNALRSHNLSFGQP